MTRGWGDNTWWCEGGPAVCPCHWRLESRELNSLAQHADLKDSSAYTLRERERLRLKLTRIGLSHLPTHTSGLIRLRLNTESFKNILT